MPTKNKILIIICYYGNFPWYFPYFLHSCQFNASIDFIIFTGNKYKERLPGNVKLIYKPLEDIKKMAAAKLGFEVNIDSPYKLCDFKPAYGFIFGDYIRQYDFWGQSDIDIIYGDISTFITKSHLSEYDFISVRHDYTSGCFALYRNNEKMNTFFMRSKDYKKVFTSGEHYCFDECNFAWDELTAGKSILDLETEIESFTHLIKSAQKDKIVKRISISYW